MHATRSVAFGSLLITHLCIAIEQNKSITFSCQSCSLCNWMCLFREFSQNKLRPNGPRVSRMKMKLCVLRYFFVHCPPPTTQPQCTLNVFDSSESLLLNLDLRPEEEVMGKEMSVIVNFRNPSPTSRRRVLWSFAEQCNRRTQHDVFKRACEAYSHTLYDVDA